MSETEIAALIGWSVIVVIGFSFKKVVIKFISNVRCDMRSSFGGQHAPLLRLGDQTKADQVRLEYRFDGSSGQPKVSSDHIQPYWSLALTKYVQVMLFDCIKTKLIDLLYLTHAGHMCSGDDVFGFR